MSKSKGQGATNRSKAFIVGGVTSVLVLLNIIPFTYSRTIQCGTYDAGHYTTKPTTQEVRRIGVPFAYWWHNSTECENADLTVGLNHTHASNMALFWNLGIIGLISVGLTFLINPTTKKVTA